MRHLIEIEAFKNFKGELRVGVRFSGGANYDKVLTRAEALTLRDQLTKALNEDGAE